MIATKLEEYKTLSELQKQYPEVKKLPSVSTIFRAVDKGVIQMINKIKEKNSKEGKVIREATKLGTASHKTIEKKKVDLTTTQKREDPEKALLLERVLEEYSKFEKASIEEILAKEKGVFNESFKGKFDSAAIVKGSPYIFDYKKTNKALDKSRMQTYFKQLCGYRLAHNFLYENKIDSLGIYNIYGKTADEIGSQFIELNDFEIKFYTDLFIKDIKKYNELLKKIL